MAYLYLDTTEKLIIGFLDSEFGWKSYVDMEKNKTSAHIHGLIHETLKENNCSEKELTGFISTNGPGSYTGVRLAEGIAQVFEWQKIPCFSFYHFNVPGLLDSNNKGVFFSKAFKGETFLSVWSGDSEQKELISNNDFEKRIQELKSEGKEIYTHFKGEEENSYVSTFTSDLIKDNSSIIFPKVIDQKLRLPPFYYRTLDKEFSTK
jgi:tRNA threonylcarbamoyladenosine biosynthesis protein TsaB